MLSSSARTTLRSRRALTTLGVTLFAAALPGSAAAADVSVTSLADAGPGTLRAAIAGAGTGDTIHLPAGTITLTSAELNWAGKDLTIVGEGARATAVSGNHASRVFDTNKALTLRDLTVRDGEASEGAAAVSKQLTLERVTMTGNHSTSAGGAVRQIARNGSPRWTSRSRFTTFWAPDGGSKPGSI